MISTGHNVTAGGGLTGGHVPLPTRTISHRVPESRPRGLDWSKHTAPTDHSAIEQARTIQAAKAAAKPRRRTSTGTKAPRFDVDRAIELYESGLSLTATGEQVGVKAQSVARRLHQRGVTIRPRNSGARRAPVRPVAAMVADYEAGMTIPELVAKYHSAHHTIRSDLRGAGVTLRDDRRANGGLNRGEIVGTEADRVVGAYQAGKSTRAIAREVGRQQKGVMRILHARGVTMRGRGEYPNPGGGAAARLRDELASRGATAADVREWAAARGLKAAPRGLPSRALIQQYIDESATTRREIA